MTEVALHIGTPKSGSTSLQDALRAAPADLARVGVGYVVGGNDLNAALAVQDAGRDDPYYWARSTHAQREQLAWQWRATPAGSAVTRIRTALAAAEARAGSAGVAPRRLVLSAENLSLAGPRLQRDVLAWCGDRPVVAVVTRRPPSPSMLSYYFQIVRLGPVDPFPVWLRAQLRRLLDGRFDRSGWWLEQGPMEDFWRRVGDVEVVHLPGRHPVAEMGRAVTALTGVADLALDVPRLNRRLSNAQAAALQLVVREHEGVGRSTIHALMTLTLDRDAARPADPSPIPAELAEVIDAAFGPDRDDAARAELAEAVRRPLEVGPWQVGDPLSDADPADVSVLATRLRTRMPAALAAAAAQRLRYTAAARWPRGLGR